MARPLPLTPNRSASLEIKSKPAPVATRLPYFPLSRSRQLDIAHSACSSIETVVPAELPTPWLPDDDGEMFTLTDDEGDEALSEPELTASSLSTDTDPRHTVSDSLLPTLQATRRMTSAVTLPGLVSSNPSFRPVNQSTPSSPSVTHTFALGQAGELTVPALQRPPLPRRSSSVNIVEASPANVRCTARARGWTFSNALPAIANYLGLSPQPSTAPLHPHHRSPPASPLPSPPLELPNSSPAYVSRIEVSFCPASPAGRACRQLIIKLRRLSDTSALSEAGPASNTLFSRPPRVVTTLLAPADAAQARVRVIYSNGRRRDFDPDVGALAIIKEIEQTTRVFASSTST